MDARNKAKPMLHLIQLMELLLLLLILLLLLLLLLLLRELVYLNNQTASANTLLHTTTVCKSFLYSNKFLGCNNFEINSLL